MKKPFAQVADPTAGLEKTISFSVVEKLRRERNTSRGSTLRRLKPKQAASKKPRKTPGTMTKKTRQFLENPGPRKEYIEKPWKAYRKTLEKQSDRKPSFTPQKAKVRTSPQPARQLRFYQISIQRSRFGSEIHDLRFGFFSASACILLDYKLY